MTTKQALIKICADYERHVEKKLENTVYVGSANLAKWIVLYSEEISRIKTAVNALQEVRKEGRDYQKTINMLAAVELPTLTQETDEALKLHALARELQRVIDIVEPLHELVFCNEDTSLKRYCKEYFLCEKERMIIEKPDLSEKERMIYKGIYATPLSKREGVVLDDVFYFLSERKETHYDAVIGNQLSEEYYGVIKRSVVTESERKFLLQLRLTVITHPADLDLQRFIKLNMVRKLRALAETGTAAEFKNYFNSVKNHLNVRDNNAKKFVAAIIAILTVLPALVWAIEHRITTGSFNLFKSYSAIARGKMERYVAEDVQAQGKASLV